MSNNQQNVSIAGGWSGAPTTYNGPAGTMPGSSGANSFVASALFIPRAFTGGDQYIFANRDVASFAGWAIGITGDDATSAFFIETGDGVGAFSRATFAPAHISGHLALIHLAVDVLLRKHFVVGELAGSGVLASIAPSALGPTVGSREGGADPAPGVEIVGVAYLANSGAWTAGAAGTHFAACHRAMNMARPSQFVPTFPGPEWTNRFDVREGLAPGVTTPVPGGGIGVTAPTVWAPSNGTAQLTKGAGVVTMFAETNPVWIS